MAFAHSKESRLLLEDFHYSGYLRDIDNNKVIDTADTTVLTDTAKTSITGLQSGKLSLGGVWMATPLDAESFGRIGVVAGDVVTYGPAGFALGAGVHCMVARATSYAVNSKITDAVDWKLDLESTGNLDSGVSLADIATITSDTDSTSSDAGASTANGGAAYLHVTNYTNLTNVVFKVQHSSDNSNWADLATFATVSGQTAERVVVASGTTVNRYLRASADVTGTGNVTYQMSFCRR